MLQILGYVLDVIDQHTVWLYAGCLVAILFYARIYAVARKAQANTIFTIEKEVAAHKEGRAMSGIGGVLAVAVLVTGLKYYVMPSVDLAVMIEPTPTSTLALPTAEPLTPTPEVLTPTITPRPTPTRRPITTLVPPAATLVPTPPCPDANVRITMPGMHSTISGRVSVRGTANHGRFQFYKLGYGQGEEPGAWHVVGDVHRTPVVDGVLEELDTTGLPNGVYWLRLTVVDQTGNFPPPCKVRVVIQN